MRKKVIIATIIIVVLGLLGFTSYKIVNGVRLKAINAEISASLKNAENTEFEEDLSSGEVVGNLTDDSDNSTENQGDDYSIDLSSADAFLETYGISKEGYSCEELYYSKIKCMVNYIKVGDISIVEIPDTCVYEVKIKGHEKEKLGGKVNEKEYNIRETNGYTIISLISGF